MAGFNNFKKYDTWNGALAYYATAYQEQKLRVTRQSEDGQHMAIEYVRFR